MKICINLSSLLWFACFIFDQGELSDAARDNFCKGKLGNYPDPNRCVGYIACAEGGYLYKMNCPANLHYNKIRDYCDWPDNLKPRCTVGQPGTPCDVDNGGCSQKCSSTGEKVKCSCNVGFILHVDQKTCKGYKHGGWGKWSDYEACDVSCGGGRQERKRLCNRPVPANGGLLCPTEAAGRNLIERQSKRCNTKACTMGPPLPPLPPLPTQSPLPPQPPALSCGANKKFDADQIVGGTVADRNRWIWQGAIYYGDQFICGGSLIHDDVFVTAAHCMSGLTNDSIVIRMGDHDRNKDDGSEQVGKVAEIIKHSEWNLKKISNDIAIIKLKRRFKLDANVGVVCLPLSNAPVPKDATCYITGWGKTGQYTDPSNLLQQAEMPIISNKVCDARNTGDGRTSKITKNVLCAGYEGPDSQVSGCKGDSGGPYVCKAKGTNHWVLQGIVSWGSRRCDSSHKFTVFTRVSMYVDWIDERSYPEP